jgi:hypothetical protein
MTPEPQNPNSRYIERNGTTYVEQSDNSWIGFGKLPPNGKRIHQKGSVEAAILDLKADFDEEQRSDLQKD